MSELQYIACLVAYILEEFTCSGGGFIEMEQRCNRKTGYIDGNSRTAGWTSRSKAIISSFLLVLKRAA